MVARGLSIAALAPLLLLATGCFYTHGALRPQTQGIGTFSLVKLPEGVVRLGRVTSTGRTSMFGDCGAAIEATLADLLEQSRALGGNRIEIVQFRGRNRWLQEPVCRRNINYAWLIVPAFLRLPTSVTARGYAVYDPRYHERAESTAAEPQQSSGAAAAAPSSMCEARWTDAQQRSACRLRQRDAYLRLQPALARLKRDPLAPAAKRLKSCYRGAQLAHGTDWQMLEACYNAG